LEDSPRAGPPLFSLGAGAIAGPLFVADSRVSGIGASVSIALFVGRDDDRRLATYVRGSWRQSASRAVGGPPVMSRAIPRAGEKRLANAADTTAVFT